MGAKSQKGAWIALSVFLLLVLLGLGLAWLTRPIPRAQAVLRLEPVSFRQLPGWDQDDLSAAMGAFQRACAPILKRANDAPIGPNAAYGRALAWQEVCGHAGGLTANATNDDAGHFFETEFTPYRGFAGSSDM